MGAEQKLFWVASQISGYHYKVKKYRVAGVQSKEIALLIVIPPLG